MTYNKDISLSAGITLEKLVDSLTVPGKQFKFPIEGIPVTVTKETRNTLLLSVGILALGGVLMSAILKN